MFKERNIEPNQNQTITCDLFPRRRVRRLAGVQSKSSRWAFGRRTPSARGSSRPRPADAQAQHKLTHGCLTGILYNPV